MAKDETKEQHNKYFNSLSKEVIQCLQEISIKKMHLDKDVLTSMLSNNAVISDMFSKSLKELENALTELKHWKGLFLEQKSKFENYNDANYNKEALFRKILLIIDSLIISPFDTELNEEFNAVRKVLEESAGHADLDECFNKLSALAKKYKAKIPAMEPLAKSNTVKDAEEGKTPLEILTNAKRNIFYDLLSRLEALLPNFSEEINTIKSQIDTKYSIAKPSRFINEIIKLFENQRSFSDKEKEELRNTILMLLSELNETEKNVLATVSAYEKKVESDSVFQNDISTGVQDIQSTFELGTDIGELKKMVKEKAKGITASIKNKMEEDLHHSEEITSELKTMQSRAKKAHIEAEQYKKTAETLKEEAYTDTLTTLPNRRAIDEKLKEEFARFARYGHPCSVLVCDLDRFKSINDKYGHQTGDTVLKKVAYLLKKNIRACDFAGRYGGEEFLVILPETEVDNALVAAEKLRNMIDESKFYYKKDGVSVTISIGISEFNDRDNCKTVFERADKALYEAKNTGRNRVVKM